MGSVLKRLFFILILALGACGDNQGTEVPDVPSGSRDKRKPQIELNYFEVELNEVLPGWSYTPFRYDQSNISEEAFRDINPNTFIMTHFIRNDVTSNEELAHITIFEGFLADGENFLDYVRARRPTEKIRSISQTTNDDTLYWIFAYPEVPGPRGGSVVDVYLSDDINAVLWLRAELLTTPENKEESWNQFWTMVSNVHIKGEENDE